jgi:hypothetical protein
MIPIFTVTYARVLRATTEIVDHRTERDPHRLALVTLAVGVTTATLGILGARCLNLGPVDDAFISLRYATNWATGHGLSFNPGERVEGYTNFLLVALESVAIRFGAEPRAAMIVLGWLALALVASLTFVLLNKHLLAGRPITAALLSVAASLNPALVGWAASGLETCLYAAALLASLLAALASRQSVRTTGTAFCLTAAALTRPEAVAFLPILGCAVFLAGRRRADLVRFGVLFVVAYGSYFVTRWLYFGFLLPNTFYAKLDYGNLWLLRRGVWYVWSFVHAAPLLIMCAAAALTRLRSTPR